MMSVTGTPRSAPSAQRLPVADTLAGMTAAFAISSALVRRNATGEGAFIDISMLDAALTAMGWAVSNFLIAGVEPKPHGNDNFTAAPSGAFRAKDGLINIAAEQAGAVRGARQRRRSPRASRPTRASPSARAGSATAAS
jgi:crotonobetainyl-CoA:carnitine CoA-transferase CaiB-like acyl-CoA transferase